ncbi:uncharacterized protein LOC109825791 [Asparagus officinalis]|nr:uncharacterized protein LOC109825791 [Asparagus officinalis]XP_020248283.1 uncharacterized protein LOC109825791 [Asparagus officinalis]
MDLLFFFLEPNHTHNSLLVGYFSKVVVCLMLRKTTSLMKYVQNQFFISGLSGDDIIKNRILEALYRRIRRRESAISSGSAGTSSSGAENTAVITVGLALISVAAASAILLQIDKKAPQVQSTEYSGPPLSYYIGKFKPASIVEAAVISEPQSSPIVEAFAPSEPETASNVQVEGDASAAPEVQVELKVEGESSSVENVP